MSEIPIWGGPAPTFEAEPEGPPPRQSIVLPPAVHRAVWKIERERVAWNPVGSSGQDALIDQLTAGAEVTGDAYTYLQGRTRALADELDARQAVLSYSAEKAELQRVVAYLQSLRL